MAYMMMLVTDDMAQLNNVLKAWETIHVDGIVMMDSTCFHRVSKEKHHIPMRFMFEKLAHGHQQYSMTLFGVVQDEATVQQCITQAETVIGDLNTAPNALFVAWPVPIFKGYPKQSKLESEVTE